MATYEQVKKKIFKLEKFKNDRDLIRHVRKNSKGKDFEEYLKRFETKGLNSEEIKHIEELLEELYINTSYLWTPGLCLYVSKMCGIANEILGKSLAKKYFRNIISRDYESQHFFLAMPSYDRREFVIDPTGIPEKETELLKGNCMWEHYRPYFGLIEHAPEYPKAIYKNSY